MKIAYGSDFHLEFYGESRAKRIIESWKFDIDTDLIIIAGDLAVGALQVVSFLEHIYDIHGIYVIYVPGNHEYYGSSFYIEDIYFNKNKTKEAYSILLDGDFLIKEPYVFVGAMGNIDGSYEDINGWKHGSLNDFHEIADFEEKHKKKGIAEFKEISTILSSDRGFKNVVITHTMPSPRCISPKYKGSYMNACFCNDWSELIYRYEPLYWICGHTHDISEVEIHNTKVMMNPFGYPHENQNWMWEYITL